MSCQTIFFLLETSVFVSCNKVLMIKMGTSFLLTIKSSTTYFYFISILTSEKIADQPSLPLTILDYFYQTIVQSFLAGSSESTNEALYFILYNIYYYELKLLTKDRYFILYREVLLAPRSYTITTIYYKRTTRACFSSGSVPK